MVYVHIWISYCWLVSIVFYCVLLCFHFPYCGFRQPKNETTIKPPLSHDTYTACFHGSTTSCCLNHVKPLISPCFIEKSPYFTKMLVIPSWKFEEIDGIFQDYDMTFTVEIVGCRDDYALSRALLDWEQWRYKLIIYGDDEGMVYDCYTHIIAWHIVNIA